LVNKMDFPKTIKIGGHDYKVLFPYSFKERSDFNGQSDNELNEIRVCEVDQCANTRPDSCIAVTMIHEILHSISHVSGMRVLNSGSKEDEQVIEMLANGLYQVFHDNKTLLDIFK
jgi:hypothetical protein